MADATTTAFKRRPPQAMVASSASARRQLRPFSRALAPTTSWHGSARARRQRSAQAVSREFDALGVAET